MLIALALIDHELLTAGQYWIGPQRGVVGERVVGEMNGSVGTEGHRRQRHAYCHDSSENICSPHDVLAIVA